MPQRTFDKLLATASGPKEFRFPERTQPPTSATALARWQLDNATLSQLGQQQPGRHVFELSARSAPVECFGYRDRESAATPVGIPSNQAPNDFHILRAQPTPLHHLGNKHSQFLPHSISGSQKKVRAPLFAPNGAKHEQINGDNSVARRRGGLWRTSLAEGAYRRRLGDNHRPGFR